MCEKSREEIEEESYLEDQKKTLEIFVGGAKEWLLKFIDARGLRQKSDERREGGGAMKTYYK